MTARRFPPPWTVEERPACFVVRDGNGQALSYVFQRVAVTRSKRNGKRCKRGGPERKAQSLRVSGAKRQHHLSATRHLPDGAQNDGRVSSSVGTGGCIVSEQRCWKLDTRGHSRTMATARPQQMQRVFIRSRMVRHG